MAPAMPEYLTPIEVAGMLKVSHKRLNDLVRMNIIPPPLVLGPKIRRWRLSDFETPQQPKVKKNTWDDFRPAKR